LWAIFEGLVANDLANYTHLLTGYNKTPSSLRVIIKIRDKLRELNPHLIHVCDPVMGDDGSLYVSNDLVSIYRDEVLPAADIILPNQTECEFLTGIKINTEADALLAVDKLHEMMVRNSSSVDNSSSSNSRSSTVLITSLYYEGPDHIIILGSERKTVSGTNKPTCKNFKFTIPRLSTVNLPTYTGTGDLFAASLLGWSIRTHDFVEATEKALAILRAVLQRTYTERLKGGGAGREILLLQSREDIVHPQVEFNASFI